MTGAPPKVFISYSHDTVEHQERVLGLADRLRADGIDAEIDQYNAAPPEGWPLWCERQIAAADVVLMVCTETYHRRVSGDEERGKGLGVVWEARIIRQLLYDAGAVSDKFVPVLFSDASPEQIPTPIKGGTRYVVDTEDGYEDLYRRLTGQPRLLRPALGTIRAASDPTATVAGAHDSSGFVIACCQATLHSGSCCWGEEGNARENTLALPSAGEKSAGSGLVRRRARCPRGWRLGRGYVLLLTPSPSRRRRPMLRRRVASRPAATSAVRRSRFTRKHRPQLAPVARTQAPDARRCAELSGLCSWRGLVSPALGLKRERRALSRPLAASRPEATSASPQSTSASHPIRLP